MSHNQPFTLQLGSWSMLGTPAAASLMARIGADWLVLDAQHGLYDDAGIIAAVPSTAGSTVLVRVSANVPAAIGRALDAGAAGVIVPMVQSAADAAAAAAACRYAPLGVRSWGPLAAYRGEPTTPPDAANAHVTCAVMVETSSALADVGPIASTPGVDIVFVGPFDLAIALGTTVADLLADHAADNPLDRVVEACRDAGTRAGAFAGEVEVASELAARGFSWIAVAVDSQLVTSSGIAALEAARQRTASAVDGG